MDGDFLEGQRTAGEGGEGVFKGTGVIWTLMPLRAVVCSMETMSQAGFGASMVWARDWTEAETPRGDSRGTRGSVSPIVERVPCRFDVVV